MNITLYTTHCPKCKVLETKLKSKNITYETCTDEAVMLQKGFMSAPMLEVDGQFLSFETAVKWVNRRT